jgi:polyhydroxybutyrate depolymerase
MTRSTRRAIPTVAITLLAVALAACSDDSPESGASVTTASVTSTTATATSTVPPAARASAGCGTAPAVSATDDPAGDVPLEFTSSGTTRTYRFGVPESYDADEPAPLILNLHGAGSNASEQSAYSQLPVEGTERGYLVVTPDAVNGMWELSGEGADDQFLTALLDDVADRYCVDLDRVHAAGISLGAWKATVTACTHPDRFASIALVAEEIAPAGCALPVVAFHGTADDVVPYGTGADEGTVVTGANANLTGVEVNMPNWAKNAGCATDKDVVRIEPDVEHWTYRDCPPGIGVEFYSIEHGDHTWPGSPVNFPGTTYTIDATEIALDWFDAHPLRR